MANKRLNSQYNKQFTKDSEFDEDVMRDNLNMQLQDKNPGSFKLNTL